MRTLFLMLLAVLAPTLAQAHQTMTVVKAYAFDTSPGMANGAAYVELRNDGPSVAELTGVSSGVAEFSQVHTHEQDGDLRRMVAVELPISIQPGETLVMEPGGMHLMFLGLNAPLAIGETIDLTFHLEGRHTKDMDLSVEVFGIDMRDELVGESATDHSHGDMDHSSHDGMSEDSMMDEGMSDDMMSEDTKKDESHDHSSHNHGS